MIKKVEKVSNRNGKMKCAKFLIFLFIACVTARYLPGDQQLHRHKNGRIHLGVMRRAPSTVSLPEGYNPFYPGFPYPYAGYPYTGYPYPLPFPPPNYHHDEDEEDDCAHATPITVSRSGSGEVSPNGLPKPEALTSNVGTETLPKVPTTNKLESVKEEMAPIEQSSTNLSNSIPKGETFTTVNPSTESNISTEQGSTENSEDEIPLSSDLSQKTEKPISTLQKEDNLLKQKYLKNRLLKQKFLNLKPKYLRNRLHQQKP